MRSGSSAGTQKTGRTRNTLLALSLILAFIFLGSTLVVQAQAAASRTAAAAMQAKPAANTDLPRRDDRYRLGASDSVALTFPLTPEFNQTVNIEPDGYASLAGAGGIRLQGMTTDEAAAAIRSAYASVLRDPVVTVELKDFNKPYFVVGGQVNKPGKYDLRGYTSATEAVAEAGGFNDTAKHSQVLLFRRVDDQWYEVRPLDLKRILAGHDVSEDTQIQSGDMLYVPQNFISKVKRYIPSSGVGAYYQLHP